MTVAATALPPRILVANRGEIAIRIVRAAADLGIEAVTVHSVDDAAAHVAVDCRDHAVHAAHGAPGRPGPSGAKVPARAAAAS